jgi:hypothetical protein
VKRLRAVQPGVLGGDTGRIRVTQQVPHGPHDADDCHATAQRWSRNCTVGVGRRRGCCSWVVAMWAIRVLPCHLSEYCQSDDGWLAGSAPSKSSAQVDGAAPPPAMVISPGWAGSRGRDRDRRSARRRRGLMPVSMPGHVCHVAEGGPSGLCGRHCARVQSAILLRPEMPVT